ncbi:UNVERIFIED_CONTAM: hypothetical protein RMT77_012298 [Armadillidium vulgare]
MAPLFSILFAFFAATSARMAYQLTDGAESILRARSFSQSFSCENLPYGYYADVDNNCEIFHICLPVVDDVGALIETAHFSFICPNQTVFSQDNLVCATEDSAFPCSEARSLYEISNSGFGVVLDE